MSTLIFDIKTVGEHAVQGGQERERAFSPHTAHVRSLALYDLTRTQGVIYLNTHNETVPELKGFLIKKVAEDVLLADFWEGIGGYTTLVSFNGRQFDLPFCALRAARYGITVPTDVIQHRYLLKQGLPRHVDLMDQFTFYGTVKNPPSLVAAARTFSITPPLPHDSGEVEKLSDEDLLAVHASELVATKALYEHWLKYLATSSFINALDLP